MSINYFEVLTPAPVLNRPDFKSVFGSEIPVKAFEFVALPGRSFRVVTEIDPQILHIEWPEYSSGPLYVDRRFGRFCEQKIEPKPLEFHAADLLKHMESRLGTPYVWGGNWAAGIPQMLEYYPPARKLTPEMETLWTFRGLDCSGLLFEATGGRTPRNTSQLVKYGWPVESEPLCVMDMIVFPGHVFFVRDQETIIESKHLFGVRIRPLAERLAEIREYPFTIRRFVSAR